MPNFSPKGNELYGGYVGQSYSSEIEITNAILFKENIGVDISPPESGLEWKPKVTTSKREEEEDYHYLIISGTPKEAGDVLIYIKGYSMGTSIPGSKINKVYVIKIKK